MVYAETGVSTRNEYAGETKNWTNCEHEEERKNIAGLQKLQEKL